jgi:hypothetical protein
MRKNDFLPRLAAAAVIITAIMFSNIFVKAQSNNEYQVVNAKVNQDAWHYEKNPCPPCPNFPVTKQESPKRLPGTNGAYVECNPSIVINPAQCQGYNNCGMQNQNAYVPLQNDGFRTWDMIACGLIFVLFGFIIGLLYKMRNNHNHGHSHHHETNHYYLGDTMIDNTEKKGGH